MKNDDWIILGIVGVVGLATVGLRFLPGKNSGGGGFGGLWPEGDSPYDGFNEGAIKLSGAGPNSEMPIHLPFIQDIWAGRPTSELAPLDYTPEDIFSEYTESPAWLSAYREVFPTMPSYEQYKSMYPAFKGSAQEYYKLQGLTSHDAPWALGMTSPQIAKVNRSKKKYPQTQRQAFAAIGPSNIGGYYSP